MPDMKFYCPYCQQHLIIDEQYAGQTCECPDMMKTVLIEKTSKKLKLYELIITALLFITLLSGFGALYIAIPLAIAVWSVTGLCLIAFVGIRIAIWWYHG